MGLSLLLPHQQQGGDHLPPTPQAQQKGMRRVAGMSKRLSMSVAVGIALLQPLPCCAWASHMKLSSEQQLQVYNPYEKVLRL